MKKQLICICMAALLSLSLLTGCGAGTDTGDTAGTEAKNVTVRLSEVTHSVFYAPQYVAMSQGFFADEGLDIELSNGGGADKVMTAVVSGGADIGLAGPESCIYIHAQGKDDLPVIFAQLTKRDGSFLVGRTPGPFSWDQVRGKTIIGGRAGGVPEMTLEYVLRANGIEPNSDVTVRTDVSFDLMGGAFMSGQDEYVALFEPSASTMELAGEGYIVASVGAGTDYVAYTAMMVTQSFRDKNPELVQNFVNALYKGQQWVDTHSAEEIANAIAPSFPDSDIQLITRVVENYKSINAWKTEPSTLEADFNQLLKVIEQAGNIDKKPEYSKIVDNSFAQKAVQ